MLLFPIITISSTNRVMFKTYLSNTRGRKNTPKPTLRLFNLKINLQEILLSYELLHACAYSQKIVSYNLSRITRNIF